MGMVETLELAAVAANSFESGGVNNTEVPNFVYRWTEREFEKAINSFDPAHRHQFRYFYSFLCCRKKLKYGVAAIAAKAFGALFPRQGNSCADLCSGPVSLNERDGRAEFSSPMLQMHPAILFAQCFAI